eukprot:GFKZ01004834.1.p1 GENE.GFKZ01004834.1~~GFKZ01004834.1.p1  ORF type:complete len:211 (+),score=32.07 GFKZ01004834.1:81-713(+)
MPPPKFIVFYDTYCGWCYGAAPALEKLASLTPYIELHHRLLFHDLNTHTVPSYRAHVSSADAKIHSLTGQPFSDKYRENIVNNSDEVLDSGLTAQAAALVHSKGPVAELALSKRLQELRYVHGVSAADRQSVVEALVDAGVSKEQAEKVDVSQDLIALARRRGRRAADLMAGWGLRSVPAVVRMVEGEGGSIIDLSKYYKREDDIVELVR